MRIDNNTSNHFGIELPHGVYGGLGADVDGDTISVHLPISDKAQWEAERICSPKANLLSAADGHVVHTPSHEALAGIYYATKMEEVASSPTPHYRSVSEMERAKEAGVIKINTRVLWKDIGSPKYYTCLGRKLIEEYTGHIVTTVLDKKNIHEYYKKIIEKEEPLVACMCFDYIQDLGYETITRYGPSICLDSFQDPEFDSMLDAALLRVEEETKDLTTDEGLALWQDTIDDLYEKWLDHDGVGDGMMKFFAKGASRVSPVQVRQLVIAKGLQARVDGSLLPVAVKGNYTKGLTVADYYLSIHGARASHLAKIKITPDSGYLTRRLVSAARDLYITERDCGNTEMVHLPDIFGHCTEDGTISMEHASGKARSVLTCKAHGGLCQKCYGLSMKTEELVDIGTAVGVIAGHSLSERIIQASMKVKHTSGAGSARTDGTSIYAPVQGECTKSGAALTIGTYSYPFIEGRTGLLVESGTIVEKGQKVAIAYPEIESAVEKIDHFMECRRTGSYLEAKNDGVVTVRHNSKEELVIYVDGKKQGKLNKSPLLVWSGQEVKAGHLLVGGFRNLNDTFNENPIETMEYAILGMYTLLRNTGLPAMQHIETAIRSLAELVIDEEGNYGHRRFSDPGKLTITGITRASVLVPSLPRAAGFGYVAQSVERLCTAPSIQHELPTDRLIQGKLLKERK